LPKESDAAAKEAANVADATKKEEDREFSNDMNNLADETTGNVKEAEQLADSAQRTADEARKIAELPVDPPKDKKG